MIRPRDLNGSGDGAAVAELLGSGSARSSLTMRDARFVPCSPARHEEDTCDGPANTKRLGGAGAPEAACGAAFSELVSDARSAMMDDQNTRATAKPALVRYGKSRIVVTQGPDRGLERQVANQTTRIGTSSDNDFVLSDHTVSRRHCSIEAGERGVRIRDEGSTNGVLLNGVRVFDALVTGATELEIGNTRIGIQPLGETVVREQAASDRFGDILGASSRMRELFADLARIAPSDATLLIEGETGTGKELVAESVHTHSLRAAGPFVVFDCSAVAASLAESELFGHERGAFTGATHARPGVFEQADGGTLFLDELGELTRDLQPKLLRALEKREVRRLGGQRTIRVDVRVIAATNRNLAAEVKLGNFREDLYFRLSATHVQVPPLRDRLDDLPLLVAHFLSMARPPRDPSAVPSDVWEMFRNHRWPGNVRELSNAVQRLLLTPERTLRTDAPSAPAPASELRPVSADGTVLPLRVARRNASDRFERDYLELVLERAARSVSRAAAIAEVSRQMVQKLMRKHGLG